MFAYYRAVDVLGTPAGNLGRARGVGQAAAMNGWLALGEMPVSTT